MAVNPRQADQLAKNKKIGGVARDKIGGAAGPAPLIGGQVLPTEPSYTEAVAGYGGGDYEPAVAAAPIVQKPDLNSWLAQNSYAQQQEQENSRLLQDYDAQTARDRTLTEADQGLRFKALDQQVNDAGLQLANDNAARGILRSGLTFQGQDQINANATRQRSGIEDILSDFINQRQSGRVDQEAKNRAAIADARQKAIDQYNSLYGGGV